MRLLLLCAPLAVACGAQSAPTFGPFVPVGRVPTDLRPEGSLREISGVAVSRRHPDLLWVHDDSGGGANLVALRSDGSFVQSYRLRGVDARDWEDIALGPGPDGHRDYLYLADTGNNHGKRDEFAVVRIPEPDPPPTPGDRIRIGDAQEIRFRYPDDAPDVEVLLVDPSDGTPYLISKEPGAARVFRIPLPLEGPEHTAELLGVMRDLDGQLTAGDVPPDGSAVYLRSNRGVHRFLTSQGPLWYALLGDSDFIVTGDQGQGEALAVEPDGNGLIAISEGEGATIWRSRSTDR